MSPRTKCGKNRKENDKQKYKKERMEEFLLDAIEEYQDRKNKEIQEMIFVNDEPVIVESASANTKY